MDNQSNNNNNTESEELTETSPTINFALDYPTKDVTYTEGGIDVDLMKYVGSNKIAVNKNDICLPIIASITIRDGNCFYIISKNFKDSVTEDKINLQTDDKKLQKIELEDFQKKLKVLFISKKKEHEVTHFSEKCGIISCCCNLDDIIAIFGKDNITTKEGNFNEWIEQNSKNGEVYVSQFVYQYVKKHSRLPDPAIHREQLFQIETQFKSE